MSEIFESHCFRGRELLYSCYICFFPEIVIWMNILKVVFWASWPIVIWNSFPYVIIIFFKEWGRRGKKEKKKLNNSFRTSLSPLKFVVSDHSALNQSLNWSNMDQSNKNFYHFF